MGNTVLREVGYHLISRSRMLKRRFASRRAPQGLPQRRQSALSEPEAIALANQFPGWLNEAASRLTLHFLGFLPFGPVVEIGVYRGKYLSILRAAMGETCRIVGYDIFDEAQAPLVEKEFTQAFGSLGNLHLIQVHSARLTPSQVLKDCGAAPVFMSVDGSHEAGPVLSDMRLAASALDPAGIVAMDDVLNPVALGVNEAVARFLSDDDPALVPFAYAANKMFFCRPDNHQTYQQTIALFLAGRDTDPTFQFYSDHTAKGQDLRRRYFGHDVLIVTL